MNDKNKFRYRCCVDVIESGTSLGLPRYIELGGSSLQLSSVFWSNLNRKGHSLLVSQSDQNCHAFMTKNFKKEPSYFVLEYALLE